MYFEHFGLADMPFRLTPDDRYFFPSTEHRRALSHLLFGLAQHEGFVIVTGEVGSGKTTLIERLTSELSDARYRIAKIATPAVSADSLLALIAAEFGVPVRADAQDKASLLLGLRDVWRADRVRNRRALIVVDEAQSVPLDALEELRMLSNLTDGAGALVQTILLGQPEFRRVMASGELDQLRQRVLASYHLGPLSAEDVAAYIQHRLAAAGAERQDIFDADAIAAVARLTGGIPRLINRLCGRALLNAALDGANAVTAEAVEAVAAELEADLVSGLEKPRNRPATGAAEMDSDYAQMLREGRHVIGRLLQRARSGDEQ